MLSYCQNTSFGGNQILLLEGSSLCAFTSMLDSACWFTIPLFSHLSCFPVNISKQINRHINFLEKQKILSLVVRDKIINTSIQQWSNTFFKVTVNIFVTEDFNLKFLNFLYIKECWHFFFTEQSPQHNFFLHC